MEKKSGPNTRTRRLMPTPAMVVALLALTVALSGTAYSAATINGKKIKKGTITAKQIKKSTITSKQIKNSTITSADIKNGTIAGADVKGATITADKIAAGVIPTVPPPAPIGTVTSQTAFSVLGFLSDPKVTGMSLSYTVPAGANKIVATFSAACAISTTSDSQSVIAAISVDGVLMDPDVYASFCSPGDVDAAANSGSGGETVNTGGSITRSIAAAPGQHTVQVLAIQGLVATATLDNMSLVVTSGS